VRDLVAQAALVAPESPQVAVQLPGGTERRPDSQGGKAQ
jgi:hypothetical protein